MNVTVYVEGGGTRRALKNRCRQGFSEFFRSAGLSGRMPRIFAGGGRRATYDSYRTALAKATESDFAVLLVDSEGPVAARSDAWTHLNIHDKWEKPRGATDDAAHLMVQCMEAWFLADKSALVKFFGDSFNENSLPRRADVEEVSTGDIARGLEMATRQCKRKGAYAKGRHSFAILAELDSKKVTSDSPHAKRLIDTLLEIAS